MKKEELEEILDNIEDYNKILDDIKDVKNSIQECLKLLGGE